MKLKPKFTIRDSALYNKVWRSPIGKLKSAVKTKCDSLPQKKRLTVVTLLLGLFILTAFFVFGNACYRIGLGEARKAIEIEHIRTLDLPSKSDAHEAVR